MIPLENLVLFALAALLMVLSPGPNMIYLISRSLSQGKQAGIISLFGVMVGFLFHILMVSFGLTALLNTIPFAYMAVKSLGVCYLLFLAFKSISSDTQIFKTESGLQSDSWFSLFQMGLFTNILNPKIAFFYLSFFPQFINPELGSVILQSFQLGFLQIIISFSVNLLLVISAAKMTVWFTKKPIWMKVQKWFMGSVLTGLALKLAFSKSN